MILRVEQNPRVKHFFLSFNNKVSARVSHLSWVHTQLRYIRVEYMILFHFKSTSNAIFFTPQLSYPPTTHLLTINHFINVLACFRNQQIFSFAHSSFFIFFFFFDFEVKINRFSFSRHKQQQEQNHQKNKAENMEWRKIMENNNPYEWVRYKKSLSQCSFLHPTYALLSSSSSYNASSRKGGKFLCFSRGLHGWLLLFSFYLISILLLLYIYILKEWNTFSHCYLASLVVHI